MQKPASEMGKTHSEMGNPSGFFPFPRPVFPFPRPVLRKESSKIRDVRSKKAKKRRQIAISGGIILILVRLGSLRALHWGLPSNDQANDIAIGGCLIVAIFALFVVRANIEREIMSFQAYLDNIKTKTGKGPDDFRRMAEEKGFTEGGKIKSGIKAGAIVQWLKDDFDLGHGHAMAIYALLKGGKSDESA